MIFKKTSSDNNVYGILRRPILISQSIVITSF